MAEITLREVRQGPGFVVCACIHAKEQCCNCNDFDPIASAEPGMDADDLREDD